MDMSYIHCELVSSASWGDDLQVLPAFSIDEAASKAIAMTMEVLGTGDSTFKLPSIMLIEGSDELSWSARKGD